MGESARPIVTDVILRRAESRDVDAVAALEVDSFSDPWSRQAMAFSVTSPDVLCTVAESADGGELLGYVIVVRAADEMEVLNLAVARSHRKRGIGRALLARALSDAISTGARAVFLEVRDGNQAARALYSSAGFEPVGRRVKYYRRPVEDALILRKSLNAAADDAG